MAFNSYRDEFKTFSEKVKYEHLMALYRIIEKLPANMMLTDIESLNMNQNYHSIIVVTEVNDPNFVVLLISEKMVPTYFIPRNEFNTMTLFKLKKDLESYILFQD